MLNFFVKCCKCVKNSINNFHIADVLFFFYIKDFEKLGGKYIREEYLFEAISYKMSKGNVLIHGNQYPVIVREFKGGRKGRNGVKATTEESSTTTRPLREHSPLTETVSPVSSDSRTKWSKSNKK